MEQFQNHPIGIPKLMEMHLKTFEHPRTPCFREYSPRKLPSFYLTVFHKAIAFNDLFWTNRKDVLVKIIQNKKDASF